MCGGEAIEKIRMMGIMNDTFQLKRFVRGYVEGNNG